MSFGGWLKRNILKPAQNLLAPGTGDGGGRNLWLAAKAANAVPEPESIIPLVSDPFDQKAVAARQHEARRMADGVQETFTLGKGSGIKPGAPIGAEPIITTMTGKEQQFTSATGLTSQQAQTLLEIRRRAARAGF
jgi:hypothetical protein